MKVLVVDDEPGVRRATLNAFKYLSPVECTVWTAGNGAEAVQMAREHKPELIIMDIRMPVMDGYEAVRRIREDGIEAVIIFFTAFSLDEKKEQALAAGGDDYLVKPITNWEKEITRLVDIVGERHA